MKLEKIVEEFFKTRSSAPISELVELILKRQEAGELDEEDRLWIEKAERRGLEVEVDRRFRSYRFTHRGVSVRRLATYLDQTGVHHWVDLRRILAEGTKEEKAAVVEHAWSVIKEAVGMIREQRQIIISCGVPQKAVDSKISALVREAFRQKPGKKAD